MPDAPHPAGPVAGLHRANFRDSLRGRAFTALFLVCALLLAKPWLSRLTRLHAEMVSAAAPAPGEWGDVPIATVLIDERDYQGRFGATSPLNRALLAEFFASFNGRYERALIGASDTSARLQLPSVIGVDLDLAPANPADAASDGRKWLDRELDKLAKRVPLVLVRPLLDAQCLSDRAACLACRWVGQREARGVRFASSLLTDDRGAMFNRSTDSLGVEMARAARPTTPSPDTRAWFLSRLMKPEPQVQRDRPCDAADAPTAPASHTPDESLARVGAMLGYDLAEAPNELQALMGYLVVVGGAYDPRDTVWPPGLPAAVPSAKVHAWAAAGAARPYRQLVKLAVIALEVLVGVVVGWGFHRIWVGVGRSGAHFARLGFWYVLFWLAACGLPLAILVFARDLQLWGLDALSLGLLTVGMSLDSVISSHEELIHRSQFHPPDQGLATPLDRVAEFAWAGVQWGVIAAVLVSHAHELGTGPALALGVLAAGCYFWPGGPLSRR